MRRLFIVGAKLLGLLCLWWAIFTTIQIISFGGMFFLGEKHDTNWVLAVSATLYGVGLLAYFVLAIWFAMILLLRTEWLAEKVGLEKDSELTGWPEEKKLLNLGVVLLGFYVLVYAIPDFVKSSLTLFSEFLLRWPPEYRDVGSFLMHYGIPVFKDVIGVAIGFLLILMPNRIIGWAEKLQKKLECKLTKSKGHDEEDIG